MNEHAQQRFKSVVTKQGGRVFVVLPFDPDQVWGVKQRHHVRGTINGSTIRGPLGAENGRSLLLLGAAWRRDNGIEAGAEVDVELAPEGPQAGALAADIQAALDGAPDARLFFDSLATFYRNGYVRWIEGARRPETRTARIAEMISLLQAGKKQR